MLEVESAVVKHVGVSASVTHTAHSTRVRGTPRGLDQPDETFKLLLPWKTLDVFGSQPWAFFYVIGELGVFFSLVN